MLSKPAPLLSVLDKVYRGAMNAILPRDLSLPARVSKDAQDRLLVENGLPIVLTLAAKASVPPFVNGVSLILGSSPKPKVFWVNTRRCVARMANFHASGYYAFVRSIKKPTRDNGPRPFWNKPVSTSGSRSSPKPATSFLIYSVARQMIHAFFHERILLSCGSHLNRGSK